MNSCLIVPQHPLQAAQYEKLGRSLLGFQIRGVWTGRTTHFTRVWKGAVPTDNAPHLEVVEMSLTFVITSIQAPTKGVQSIAGNAAIQGADFIVIGDEKSPKDWICEGARYFSLESQLALDFALVEQLPTSSYSRKMLGYLLAISAGAQWIRETDDDNSPNGDFFEGVPDSLQCKVTNSTNGWYNAYTHFTDRFVWPRGFPLSLVRSNTGETTAEQIQDVRSPFILQALADGDPDVDAIYRLTAPDPSDITFERKGPLALSAGVWCPFNSQATTWPRELFALMYLPVTCTFRMTDIWRSFVAQRLLAGLGATLIFTAPTVNQDRNEHDLMADFKQEVPGYLGTEKIRRALDAVAVLGGHENVMSDLRSLYEALVYEGFLAHDELPVLEAWIEDVHRLAVGS